MPYPRAFVSGGLSLFVLTVLILLSSPFFSGGALADEFKLTPSLGLKEEYNDNLFFTGSDRTKDFTTTISPGLDLINKTETLDLNLVARLDILRYVSNKALNDVDNYSRGRLRYSLNPRLNVSTELGFAKDSRPDQDIDVSGLVFTKAVTRYKYNYAAGGEYIVSEKTKVNLSYAYENSDFKDPGFTDIKSHDVTLGSFTI